MNLESLLRSAGSEGEFDSEGQFTIDGRAAMAKLAAFQLPRPTAWVLKLCQAAVAGGAQKLLVRQTKEVTVFEWEPAVAVSYEELRAALASHQPADNLVIRHLAAGLRAVGMGQDRSFAARFTDGTQEALFQCQARAMLLKVTESREPIFTVAIGVQHANDKVGFFRKFSQTTLDEAQELAWGCQACPIEVRLDGLRLDTLAARDEKDWSSKTRIDLAVIWRPLLPDALLPPISLPAGLEVGPLGWRPTDRFTDKRTFEIDGPEQRHELCFIARLSYVFKVTNVGTSKGSSFAFETYRGPSYANWVCDGVVVARKELALSHSSVRLDLFLSGQGLDTDISGLLLTEGPEYRRRLAEAVGEAADNLGHTASSIEMHKDRPLNSTVLGLGSFITVHGMVMALGTKGLTIPFHLAFAATMYKQVAGNFAEVRQDCLEALRMLQTQMEHLADGL